MADNVIADPGAGGATFATDDIGSVHYPRTKVSWGVDGAAVDASASNPLPVVQTGALPAGSANIGDVDVLSVPAPLSTTGGGLEVDALRVTVASDSTGVLSVDDNGASLTVDGSVTANAGTNLNTSALALEAGGNLAAIAASEAILDDWDESDRAKVNPIVGQAGVQGASGVVTALTQRVVLATDVALPAGTNNIGDVDVLTIAAGDNNIGNVDVVSLPAIPAGTNNIGDVDVLSVIPGTGATNLGKAEDAAQAGGDVGVMALAVRDDALTTLTPIDGDYVPLRVNSTGALHVTGGGGGTEYVVNAVAPADPTGPTFVMERDDALSALTEVEGDWTNPRSDANGALWIAVGTPVPAGTNNIGDVDVASIAAGDNNIGNVDIVSLPALPAGTNNIGDVDVLTLPAIPAGTNNIGDVDVLTVPADPFGVNADAASATGSISAKLRFIASTGIPITGTVTVGSHAVTNAGTFAVQVDGAALTALQLIDDPVIADDAGFTPATSKVMMAGFQADEASTDSVDEGDAGAARMTLDRKVIVTPQPHAAGGLSIHRSIDLDEGTLEVVKASPGCVYGMWVTNTSTGTRWIKFYDATSGTYGTGTPVITIGIPGNATDDIAGNFGPGGMGITFATGISVGAGTGVADADTGAPGANDVIVNIYYK